MDAAYQSSLDWFIQFTLRKNCRRMPSTTGERESDGSACVPRANVVFMGSRRTSCGLGGVASTTRSSPSECGTANVSDDEESRPSSSSSPTTSASSSPLHRISLPGSSGSSGTTTPATTTSPTTTTGRVTSLRLPAAADLSSPSSSAASPAASFSSPSSSTASAATSAPLPLPPWAVPQSAVDVLLRQWNWGFRENRPEDTCPNAVYWELYDRFPQREGHYRRQVQRDISALLRKVVPKDRVLGFEPTAESAAESAYAPAPAAERVCRRGPPPGFGAAAASAPAHAAAPAVATSSCAPASGRVCRRGPPPGFGATAPVSAPPSPGLVVVPVQQGSAAVGGGSTRPAVRRSALTAALRREGC